VNVEAIHSSSAGARGARAGREYSPGLSARKGTPVIPYLARAYSLARSPWCKYTNNNNWTIN